MGRTQAPSPRAWRAEWGYLLVFITSLCTLVLEILAGRILAPVVGVSLFTWTTIIGVVLAGIAVGNYAGGRLARRGVSALTVGIVLLLASGATWQVAVLVRLVSLEAVLGQFPLLARLVLLVGALFFVPSALLATVTPLVAQLVVRRADEAGAVVGRLGAASAAGSIAGTFLTGFVLIPAFGSRTILWAVAATLLALGLAVAAAGARDRGWRWPVGSGFSTATSGALLGAALVGGGSVLASSRDQNACLRETAYNCIRVAPYAAAGMNAKALVLDRLVHGFAVPEEPRAILWGNAQAFADVAVYHVERLTATSVLREAPPSPPGGDGGRDAVPPTGASGSAPLRALFVGGGSYTLPRYLASVYSGSEIEVLEIDPGVTTTAQTSLGLRLDGGIRVSHVDARVGFSRLPASSFHLVLGDAFNDVAIPWHLTTLEFAREVRRVLREDGLYIADVTERWPSGRFLPAFVRTLREVFPVVTLVRTSSDDGWDRDLPRAWLVVGSSRPLDAAHLERVTRPGVAGPEPSRARVLDPARVAAWLAASERSASILTDDFAPVDDLLAPLILGR